MGREFKPIEILESNLSQGVVPVQNKSIPFKMTISEIRAEKDCESIFRTTTVKYLMHRLT